MKVLKGHVRNRARPEGYIAECYLADECVQFCGRYISQAANVGLKHASNEDLVFKNIVAGHPPSAREVKIITSDLYDIACRYILSNGSEVEVYIK